MIKEWLLDFRESQRDRELGLASLSYLCNISTRSITIVQFQSNHWKSVIIIVFNKKRQKHDCYDWLEEVPTDRTGSSSSRLIITIIIIRSVDGCLCGTWEPPSGVGHHRGFSLSFNHQKNDRVLHSRICRNQITGQRHIYTTTWPKNDQNSLQNWVDLCLPQQYTTFVAHLGGGGGSIVDRVPVSVSEWLFTEWLFGSFVLILFGDYVYFSGFNSHISKE